jgi:mRNA interferase MazF
MVNRFDIWVVDLNPTQGKEINKARPCVVVSPNEISFLNTVLIAPMTSQGFDLPCRVPCQFMNKNGFILLDQMRSVDRLRLRKKLGYLDESTQKKLCDTLQDFFAC